MIKITDKKIMIQNFNQAENEQKALCVRWKYFFIKGDLFIGDLNFFRFPCWISASGKPKWKLFISTNYIYFIYKYTTLFHKTIRKIQTENLMLQCKLHLLLM